MKRILSLGMVAVLMATAGAVCAYPSLLGPTGGANLPVAAVAPEGQFNFALDYFNQKEDGIDAAWVGRALYGVGQNLEVGATYTKQDTQSDFSLDAWGVNAKYIASEELGGFAVAVGGLYNKFTDGDVKAMQFYAVGTRVLAEATETSPAIRGSVGVNWTQFDIAGSKTDAFRPFVDFDFAFNGGTNVTAEYQFENSDLDDKGLASLVVRHAFTQDLSGQIGISNAFRGMLGGDNYDLLVGVNYKFASK